MISREKQTPEQREMFAERRRARDRAKRKRQHAAARAAKRAKEAPLKSPSRTDPVTRRRLYGIVPEMSKDRLRAIIAQAVRNTAEMALEA